MARSSNLNEALRRSIRHKASIREGTADVIRRIIDADQ